MGQINTEQTVAIIDSIGEALNNAQPNMTAEPNMNFWGLMWIAVAPVVIVPLFLWGKKALSKKKGKKNG